MKCCIKKSKILECFSKNSLNNSNTLSWSLRQQSPGSIYFYIFPVKITNDSLIMLSIYNDNLLPFWNWQSEIMRKKKKLKWVSWGDLKYQAVFSIFLSFVRFPSSFSQKWFQPNYLKRNWVKGYFYFETPHKINKLFDDGQSEMQERIIINRWKRGIGLFFYIHLTLFSQRRNLHAEILLW